MKKLKKLLSFVLALSMVLTSGMVSVGAANYTDEEDIVCLEAVQTLSELNIIVGKEDGRFDPDGTVTRAEMAKMLYVLANGGVDDGAKGYPASGFTDIKGTWGENYINAAYSLGLTAGIGNNKFGPSQTVTAAQVYKMLLNLVGYEDSRSGMTGSEWAQNALRLAVKTGLTENIYGIDQSEGMPRQYAAQAIYNVIDTYRVKVDDTGEYVEYTKEDAQPTVGEKYLRLETIEGVYLGNDETSLAGSPESDGYIRIAEVENGEETGKTFKIEYDADIDLIGQIVKVMFKTERNNSSNYIGYGMYATGDSEIEPFTIVDDYDIDDLENDESADATVFVNNELVKGVTIDELIDGEGDFEVPASAFLRIIYNDDLQDEDGKTSKWNSLAFVFVPALNEVSTYSGDTLTFADPVFVGFDKDGDFEMDKSFDLDDNDIEYVIDEDVEEEDKVIVLYNAQADILTVQKAESVSGELTGIRGGNELRIDGEWYSYDGDKMKAWSSYVEDDDFETEGFDNGEEYTLYLLNGFYLAAEEGSESGSSNDDYAIVTGAYDVGEELRVKLLTADGLEKTYTIGEFCEEDVDDINDIEGLAEALTEAVAEGPVVVEYTASDDDADIDKINVEIEDFGFEDDTMGDVLGDESFELNAGDDLFFKESTGRVIGEDFDAYLDTDAAIFFDEAAGDDWDAYEFDALDDDIEWDELTENSVVYVVMDDDEVICLAVYDARDAAPSSSTTGIHFGYLTGKPVDNGDYIEYTFWNGEETVEYEQDETSAQAARSAIFAYTLDGDMIDDIYTLMDEDGMKSKEFKDYTAVYGIISDVSGDRIKTKVIEGFTVNGKNEELDVKEAGEIVSAEIITDSILWSIDSDDRAGAGEAKLRKNNQVIMLINEDDEIEFAVVDTNGYFKKGNEFFNGNTILSDADERGYYATLTDAEEVVDEVPHTHELTYRNATSTEYRVVIECDTEKCEGKKTTVDFTVEGETVSAEINSNELGLKLDVKEIAKEAKLDDGKITWNGVTVTPQTTVAE